MPTYCIRSEKNHHRGSITTQLILRFDWLGFNQTSSFNISKAAESKHNKLEVKLTVVLPPMVSVLWLGPPSLRWTLLPLQSGDIDNGGFENLFFAIRRGFGGGKNWIINLLFFGIPPVLIDLKIEQLLPSKQKRQINLL